MSKPIKKSDIDESLNIMVASGIIFASCPICKEYLSHNEYIMSHCNKCKEIDFDSITYFDGVKKDNN